MVEKLSLEELQDEVRGRIQSELGPVSDEIIFNTDDKPYAYFIIVLIHLYICLSFLVRWVL
jgi:hypothetical protein